MKTVIITLSLFFFAIVPVVEAGEMTTFTEVIGDATYYVDGELTGSAVEVVREIKRRVGDKGEIQVVPWKRGYEAAKFDANVALFPTTRTPEREHLFHWIGPIQRIQWVLMRKAGSPINIHSLDDARKVRAIGTYLGDAREELLKKKGFTNLESASNIASSYRKLVLGRIDLVIGATVGLRESLERAEVDPDDIEVAYVVKETNVYVALSKKTDQKHVRAWKAAFRSMVEEGEFQRIYKKWYPELTPPVADSGP
ncbi:MAG: transporter substrate-binding domain-containing protein [Pseudodesulfovibrio sp.]